ncbi:energy transducer TonB [Xylanimonas oleitrophica]|uniref:Energy transducer TonB n=1 Tax=Xylanimonas oleitrophica TaxID=2607479 RepID=A0A2W5XQ08_9MICO|nr:Rv3235 family protein [Xylanimonas oleitrophica]PZR51538.1 energy transducer TonB [Xylanimonas oleitrophica]
MSTLSPTTTNHGPASRRPLRVGPVPPAPGRRVEPSVRPPRVRTVRLGTDRRLPVEVDEMQEAAAARPVVERPAAPLPDPTAMCCAVVRAAAEVLRGDRPAAQLTRWVTPVVLDQLTERARLVREAPASTTAQPAGRRPVQVRRVRLERHGESAEATVVLDDGGRVRAAAVRLEARRGQWRVAVLELG